MKIVIFYLSIFSLAACAPSLRFYTKEMNDDNRWSDSQLKKIQFYVSNDIVLWRDINHGESIVKNGKISMIEGREVEEVVISRGTKGLFLFSPQKNHYAIGFDPNDDTKFLVFGPTEKANDRYVLLAKDWDKNFGKITYGDKVYNTSSKSAFACLMVNMDISQKTKVNFSRPSGRQVN